LTRQINACIPEVLDEIQYTFDTHFTKGEDVADGWKNVMINDAIRKAVCGVANRVIIGLPVCRSQEYFDAVQKWWVCFGLTGLVFRSFVPRPLQRVIMPVLSLPTWYWRRRIVRMFEPEVARRVTIIQDAKARGEPLKTSKDDGRSNDLMQWLIEQSTHSKDPAEMSPRNLSNKLVLFNLFGKNQTILLPIPKKGTQLTIPPATHTLTTTLTSLLTTLLSHPTSTQTLTALRHESSQILPQAATSPTSTKQMPLHDSLLRETLRLNPAFDDSMLREVVAPAGVHTPEGVYLPCGSHVAMHTRLMQRSEWAGGVEGQARQDWGEFKPFRWCDMAAEARRREAEGSEGNDATKEEKEGGGKGQVGAVQISERYMLFGLGRHAW
jgi:hypothetical protein